MNFVIFDLEWNNAYNYKAQTGMNEIIEIGAVMLDERLQIVDTFKQLILPKVSKRLTGRFKDLTHITTDEVKQNGIPFEEAFRDFARWSGADNCVFMSWSDSDLYVLAGNYKYFSQRAHVPFMQRYADAQKYCMRFLTDNPNNNQISLAHCAEKFQISVEEENLHRALEDCYVALRKCMIRHCLSRIFVTAPGIILSGCCTSPITCATPFAVGSIFDSKSFNAPVAIKNCKCCVPLNFPTTPLRIGASVGTAAPNIGCSCVPSKCTIMCRSARRCSP